MFVIKIPIVFVIIYAKYDGAYILLVHIPQKLMSQRPSVMISLLEQVEK